MEQLLDIQTVPISMEFRVQRAKLEYSIEAPTQQVTKDEGSLSISHQFPRLQIDTLEARSSMGFKTAARVSKESAVENMRAAMDATAKIVEQGNALARVQDGVNVPSMIQNAYFQSVQNSLESTLGATPSVPAAIDWEPFQFSMRFEADKLYFDWRTQSKVQMEYTPAKVEFVVKEYPHLEINYIGKPIYVPPSASPDYQPPMLDFSA